MKGIAPLVLVVLVILALARCDLHQAAGSECRNPSVTALAPAPGHPGGGGGGTGVFVGRKEGGRH